ncbi:hypothetical protein FQR65_LT00248 [Abscondita terminalis]|nr:hypothetical protein FQR65_LT00248 [Abscondita terminalis]
MADTVKKSRIVSETDENLEESLLEEFNLRLKKCLSRENLQQQENDDDSHIYENVAVIKNGDQKFLEEERRCSETSNGDCDSVDNCKIYAYDCDSAQIQVDTSLILPNSCLNDEAELKSVKDRMFLSTEDASCLLFTQTVTSPMLTPSEENIDFLKGFQNEPDKENVYENVDVIRNTDQNLDFIEHERAQHHFEEELKSVNIVKQINQYEHVEVTNDCSNTNETNINEENAFYNVNVKNLCRSFGNLNNLDDAHCRTDVKDCVRAKSMTDVRSMGTDNVYTGVSVKALKSSFSKFDALQKKNILNAAQPIDQESTDACKKCGRPVFQMERVTAEKCVWHRNCFRCVECSKQLLVDNFESHEGTLYCKPHFKALFQPKAVEDDAPSKPRKHELIIRENQPAELPPDVARASDKPDLGLEELHSLNVKERFRVFENAQNQENTFEKSSVKMERSQSILSKLARFQAKGMNVGVSDDYLNGVPVEGSSEEEDDEADEGLEGEDADLVRAKRVQKEKPFHFLQMSDVKSKWEQGNQHKKDDLREERKQEIQNIRSRLFLGKQGKMKEAYQQAIVESESHGNVKKEVPVEFTETRSIKDKFERGDVAVNEIKKETEDMSIFESGISKKSRSIFLELDAGNVKAPKISPTSPIKLSTSVRSAREAYVAKQASEDTVKSSDQLDEITVRTSDIQDRFKFFETYREPQQKRREFRMTPPREGQTKSKTPEREVYVDPEIVRSDEVVEDSGIAKSAHTATKMLSKFRQMEENLLKEQEPQGPKPLKRFTPPREPLRRESSSEHESASDEDENENDHRGMEQDLIEAQKAARAQKLRAKFERWEQGEIKRENSVNLAEEIGDEQSQLETAKSLCAKFESLRETNSVQKQTSRVKVNRFVGVVTSSSINCEGCKRVVYPLEAIAVHGLTFHKNCFRCVECKTVLRMNSFSYNKGLLYCVTHFKRLFITKGNYDSAFDRRTNAS